MENKELKNLQLQIIKHNLAELEKNEQTQLLSLDMVQSAINYLRRRLEEIEGKKAE